VIAKVREVVAFGAMPVGLNPLVIDGGATTAREADAVPPAPPSVDETFPVMLLFAPAVVPVTFTENVHELLAAIVPPERPIEFPPAAAVIVPEPHVPVRPLGVETSNPAGSVSLKNTPVAPEVALLF
jgi:hypothetical protein